MSRMSEADVLAHQRRIKGIGPEQGHFAPTSSKYRNVKVTKDGQQFDSKLEARRWQALQLMEKAGEIRDLKAQVKLDIRVGNFLVCSYIADAVYIDCVKNCLVVEDCKSKASRTPVYQLKKKLVKAVLGIEITEIYSA